MHGEQISRKHQNVFVLIYNILNIGQCGKESIDFIPYQFIIYSLYLAKCFIKMDFSWKRKLPVLSLHIVPY